MLHTFLKCITIISVQDPKLNAGVFASEPEVCIFSILLLLIVGHKKYIQRWGSSSGTTFTPCSYKDDRSPG
jgi:hypothetical protein